MARHVLDEAQMVRGAVIASAVALVAGLAAPAHAGSSRRRLLPREGCRSAHATEVVGVVVDAAGRAVPNASVFAAPVTGARRARASAITDGAGRFKLVDLPPGQYFFIGVHGDHPFGMTPPMPVMDRLEVAITLDLLGISA
jgi:hypothetical protein